MDNETMKSELRKKGYSMAMIASALHCSPGNVQQVVSRANHSHRVATAIALVLELPVEEAFPDVPAYKDVKHFTNSRQERIDALEQRLAG